MTSIPSVGVDIFSEREYGLWDANPARQALLEAGEWREFPARGAKT